MTVQALLTRGLQYHRAGRFTEAEALYRQILATHPDHPHALHLLGALAHQIGRPDVAVAYLQRAVVLKPAFAPAHYNLGNALREQHLVDAAIAAYRRAIELQPDYGDAHHNLGLALKTRRQLAEAEAAYRRAAELQPTRAETHSNLGNVLQELGRTDEALLAYQQALTIQPDFAPAHYNLGNLLRERKRLDQAIAAYRRALDLQPDHVEAHHNLGLALCERGHLEEAAASFRRVLDLRPDDFEAQKNLGVTLTKLGHFEQSIRAYRRALDLRPNDAETHNNLGVALKEHGQLDAAIAAHRRALELEPSLAEAHNNLGVALKERGDLVEAIAEFRQAVELAPDQAPLHSNLIFALHFDPSQDDQSIAAEEHRWNQRFAEPFRPSLRTHPNDYNPTRPLKIGYLSPDFCNHTAGRNLLPLFQHHDRANFEILCYSGVLRPDAYTAEFRKLAAHWRSTLGVPTEDVAALIRQDGVDILVELAQHTFGNRLPVLARKPAPIQLTFLAYPGRTGLETVDYRISDPWLESGSLRIETLAPDLHVAISVLHPADRAILIDSFWCYAPPAIDVPVNPLPAHTTGRITFGSLNNFSKFNEHVWRLWARVLTQVENSRLAVLSEAGTHRERVLDLLQAEGISPDRVQFFPRCPQRAYLELHHRLDIVLDPFPYNGHTTTLDSLWMGVPVVSLAGKTPVSRGGLSILQNIGLPEFVASTEDEYVRIATELAHDHPRLAVLRATLRSRLQSSVLTDAPRFARNIEVAYRAAWQQWCAHQPAWASRPTVRA